MSFERIVEIHPAWDKRSDIPSKIYGIHGCALKMVLKGPLGAVQFVVYTNWHLPHVTRELDARIMDMARVQDLELVDLEIRHPLPADVGYHSPKPLYDGQSPMDGECEYVEGGKCHYDGSGLRAEEWFNEKLLVGGSDAIWAALEEEYRDRFGADTPLTESAV